MKTADVIKHYGSIKKASQKLDIFPQTIYAWGDTVPDKMSYKIQVLTNNVLTVNAKK